MTPAQFNLMPMFCTVGLQIVHADDEPARRLGELYHHAGGCWQCFCLCILDRYQALSLTTPETTPSGLIQ